MTELTEGAPAPDFDLETDGGGRVRLSELRGRNVVLYFYPKDDTPGCTTEAIAFTGLADAFAAADTVVIGVSKDSAKSHDKFKAKHALNVVLASDPDGGVVEAYGAWVEKSMYGRKYMGVDRSTFLIDGEGRIKNIWRKVKVPGHADAVLKAAKALAGSSCAIGGLASGSMRQPYRPSPRLREMPSHSWRSWDKDALPVIFIPSSGKRFFSSDSTWASRSRLFAIAFMPLWTRRIPASSPARCSA